jgi:hypothetical protein
VVTIIFQASSLDLLTDFELSVGDFMVVYPGIFKQLHKDVVGLNISVDVTKCMKFFNILNHLNP